MNELVEKSIEYFNKEKYNGSKSAHERALIRIKECFGEFAESNLIETEKPCHFWIKDTQWNLVYGFYDGFSIWHKDYPEDSSNKKDPNYKNVGKFNAWQIVDMESLGRSLLSISKTWGL